MQPARKLKGLESETAIGTSSKNSKEGARPTSARAKRKKANPNDDSGATPNENQLHMRSDSEEAGAPKTRKARKIAEKKTKSFNTAFEILKGVRKKVNQEHTADFYAELLQDLALYGPIEERSFPIAQNGTGTAETATKCHEKKRFVYKEGLTGDTERRKMALQQQKSKWEFYTMVILEDGIQKLRKLQRIGESGPGDLECERVDALVKEIEAFMDDPLFEDSQINKTLDIRAACRMLLHYKAWAERKKMAYRSRFLFLRYVRFYMDLLRKHENNPQYKDDIQRILDFHKAKGTRGIVDINMGIGDTHVQDPGVKRKRKEYTAQRKEKKPGSLLSAEHNPQGVEVTQSLASYNEAQVDEPAYARNADLVDQDLYNFVSGGGNEGLALGSPSQVFEEGYIPSASIADGPEDLNIEYFLVLGEDDEKCATRCSSTEQRKP